MANVVSVSSMWIGSPSPSRASLAASRSAGSSNQASPVSVENRICRSVRMDTTLTLVDLGGAIALLIWGVHMVQTGIIRGFGPQLRRMLSHALGNRFKGFLAGIGVTSILQSSTAT